MNKYLGLSYAVLLVAAITLTGAGSALAGADVPLMTTDELKSMLDNHDILILDVRIGKDWKSSEFKIKGATYAKPENYDEWANKYPKSKKIVLYCA